MTNFIKRWQQQTIQDALKTRRVVLLSGSRQCGKTTLARALQTKDIEYRTLDDIVRWYQLFRPISNNIKVLSVINVINHATIIFPLRGSFLKYISFGVAPSNVECGRLEL